MVGSLTQNGEGVALVYAVVVKSYLKHIEIEGYKSIRAMSLELKAFNVLIGANGAGKSNFISFFKMLYAMNQGEFWIWTQKAGGGGGLLYLDSKTTSKINVWITYTDGESNLTYDFELLYTSGNDGLTISREGYFNTSAEDISVKDASVKDFYLHSGFGGFRESRTLESTESGYKIQNQIRQKLSKTKVFQFHDTSENSRIRLTGSTDDDVSLKSDAGNLAAVLCKLKNHHPKHYKHILKTIQLTAPFFKDFVLEPNGHSIRLRYSEFGSDNVYGAHQISDGTLRFMALMTLLLQPLEQMPSVILIDEPELGLHPHALEVLLSIMRRVSTNRQIIVSTQSVSLVDRLEPEEVIVVERQNNESQFKRLDTQSLETWLEDYSLGELWEKNVFGGRPSR